MVWVVGRELVSLVVDEGLAYEPFDGAALDSSVTQRLQGRDELGMVLMELALEPTERSPAPEAPWPGVGRPHRC